MDYTAFKVGGLEFYLLCIEHGVCIPGISYMAA